jgi:hypothetical protein
MFFVVAAFFVCSISCTSASEKVTEVATAFLTAYFQTEYEEALQYCDAEAATALKLALEGIDNLPADLRAKMNEASKQTVFNIKKVDTESVKDEASVDYEISTDLSEALLTKSMTLRKIDGEWKIVAMR